MIKFLKSIIYFAVLIQISSCSNESNENPTGPELNKSPVIELVDYPPSSSRDNQSSVFFSWVGSDANNDAIKYTLYIDTINPPINRCSVQTATSYTANNLLFGKTYYWYLQATDNFNPVSTPVRSFTVRERTWQEVATILAPSTYIIGFLKNNSIIGVGSGFSVNDTTIITNAHVVLALKEYLTEWGDTTLRAIAVQNGGQIYGTGFHYLNSFAIHPQYDSTTTETYDFAMVTTKNKMPTFVEIEKTSNLTALSAGQEVASIGFPGELNFMCTQSPVATFKNGTISAVRAFNGAATTANNAYSIQYNLNLSGGTSGSPVFNKNAKIIAVNNAGMEVLVFSSSTNTWQRIPTSALNFGIRADLVSGVLNINKTLFSSLRPVIVTYKFINGTWSDLQINFLDSYITDTIKWKDTLSFWDFAKTSKKEALYLKSIVSTSNYLYWRDTLYTGRDFSKRYIVTSNHFLLGMTNSTNKNMHSVVVSNSYEYDSSYIYIPIGGYRDVGYYRSSSSTNIRTYYYSATQYLYWNSQNTLSSTSEAIYYPLTASLVLYKSTGDVANGVNQSMVNAKMAEKGVKREYRLSDYLRTRRENQ